MAQTVEIRGQKELYVALSTVIPYSLEAKTVQTALAAGAKIIADTARTNIGAGHPFPDSITGTLKRSIYQGRGRKSTPQEQIRIVNARRGKRYQSGKSGSRDAFYSRWVEYGHRMAAGKKGERLIRESRATTAAGLERYERRRVSSGRRRIKGERTWTQAHPYPFMQPAWASRRVEAEAAVMKRLQQIIDRTLTKVGRRRGS